MTRLIYIIKKKKKKDLMLRLVVFIVELADAFGMVNARDVPIMIRPLGVLYATAAKSMDG